MRRITKVAVQGVVASVGLTTCLVVGASPAQAAVYDCKASFNGEDNMAVAHCYGGFGRYRVKSKCDSPTYPYSITIYGPWVSRSSGQSHPPASLVDGDRYNCHITSASTFV
ncbi:MULTISPECIES: hypothetical protein [Streptomyces]|uniref:Uncharacterized protein n=1 Tax=Streptomyces solicathayae TaxID=3081768 RepID=A0ABZ0LW09_9ACTN|nr:hypothetical protein [Streptomyces sp. HUAS YS2]WOX23626.1 hypothetical protein R2D22_20460 [Streptomyces sp. HUAS YS2]